MGGPHHQKDLLPILREMKVGGTPAVGAAELLDEGETLADLLGDGTLQVLLGLRSHHLHQGRVREEAVDMPPLDRTLSLHQPQMSLHPSEAPRALGGAGVGVVASLEVDLSQGADDQVLLGRKAEDQGVDPFFHRKRIKLRVFQGWRQAGSSSSRISRSLLLTSAVMCLSRS
jgi:hypothetical protein